MKNIVSRICTTGLVFFSALALMAEDEAGFKPLFNGKDFSGWHLRNANGVKSWSVLPGGVLKNTVEKDVHGTDLVTNQKFWNFMRLDNFHHTAEEYFTETVAAAENVTSEFSKSLLGEK